MQEKKLVEWDKVKSIEGKNRRIYASKSDVEHLKLQVKALENGEVLKDITIEGEDTIIADNGKANTEYVFRYTSTDYYNGCTLVGVSSSNPLMTISNATKDGFTLNVSGLKEDDTTIITATFKVMGLDMAITKTISATYVSSIDNNGYDYVDLGLPSGLMWAKCNIGATNPQDPGLYFQWGGTTGHTSGYNFANNNYPQSNISADLTDSQDAACVNMQGGWRMPTKLEFQELADNCFMEWTANYNGTGKAGVIFYSTMTNATGKGRYKSGSTWYAKNASNGYYNSSSSQPSGFVAYTLDIPHIFIPAAGYYNGTSLSSSGTYGYCWSRSFYSSSNGRRLGFSSSDVGPQSNNGYRYYGYTVRAVL